MSRFTFWLVPAGALVMLLALSGCEDKSKTVDTAPIQPVTPDYDAQIRDLEDQLRAAQAGRDADRDRIRALQNELERLRKELAAKAEPPPAPNWQNVPGGAMTSIEGTVLFDSGKAVLKPGARRTLDEVARVINEKYPDYDIYVFGHTDSEPIRFSGWKDNYELSCQRALTVVRALRQQLGEANLSAGGWGEYRPVAENDTPEARQANRRVEIYAMRPAEAGAGGSGRSSPPHGR